MKLPNLWRRSVNPSKPPRVSSVEAQEYVGPEDWSKVVNKTERDIMSDWDRDTHIDNIMESSLIISVTDSDDEFSDNSDVSDSAMSKKPVEGECIPPSAKDLITKPPLILCLSLSVLHVMNQPFACESDSHLADFYNWTKAKAIIMIFGILIEHTAGRMSGGAEQAMDHAACNVTRFECVLCKHKQNTHNDTDGRKDSHVTRH
ncbi:hypothetical protein EVAR_61178_1 [Eumeta japonica]|uniref:Uncharacterized protein n=1 Tax=Eumeta variegata TaxID=151549 RepID=A0A4C1ZIA9_EUMVA|nr:hypothetical protein EVAR_61178_1 [Eumeta japonica]